MQYSDFTHLGVNVNGVKRLLHLEFLAGVFLLRIPSLRGDSSFVGITPQRLSSIRRIAARLFVIVKKNRAFFAFAEFIFLK